VGRPSQPSRLESTQVGVAGEYFVAAELSIRGFLATITLRNSRGIDIIASNPDASRSVSIQVKTSNGGSPKWILNRKAESYFGENHYYVFVVLSDIGQRPDFYVVPSKVVAEYTSISHREWLAGRKADGSARKDSAIRNFRDPEGQYKEAWSSLEL
jgi:hypothetical protein